MSVGGDTILCHHRKVIRTSSLPLRKVLENVKKGTSWHPRQGVLITAAWQSYGASKTQTQKSSLLPAAHTLTAVPHHFPYGIPVTPGPLSLLLKCTYTLDVSRGAAHTLCATSCRKPGQPIVLGSGVHGGDFKAQPNQDKALGKGLLWNTTMCNPAQRQCCPLG